MPRIKDPARPFNGSYGVQAYRPAGRKCTAIWPHKADPWLPLKLLGVWGYNSKGFNKEDTKAMKKKATIKDPKKTATTPKKAMKKKATTPKKATSKGFNKEGTKGSKKATTPKATTSKFKKVTKKVTKKTTSRKNKKAWSPTPTKATKKADPIFVTPEAKIQATTPKKEEKGLDEN